MDALYCCQCPAAFINLLCSMAATWTKNNSKNAQAIAMPSACNIANVVVWLCSIDAVARLLCSMAATWTKNNSKNAPAIAMPSACNIASIVVWLCSIDPVARLLCSRAATQTKNTSKNAQTIAMYKRSVTGRLMSNGRHTVA